MKRINPLTADIIVQTLKRSSLPTVLVEGEDDIFIYRHIENLIGVRYFSFIQCGGRNTLLEVYKKRSEFARLKTLFIADKDMWVFVGVPKTFNKNIIFTKGYSIENDLYSDGKKWIDRLLTRPEIQKKEQLFENLIRWFAFEVELFEKNKPEAADFSDITILNTNVIPKNATSFTEQFLLSRCFVEPGKKTLSEITSEYELKLRGKFIFQVFEKIFQERIGKHNTKYSRNQLFENCFFEGVNAQESSCMKEIISKIQTHFKKN